MCEALIDLLKDNVKVRIKNIVASSIKATLHILLVCLLKGIMS